MIYGRTIKEKAERAHTHPNNRERHVRTHSINQEEELMCDADGSIPQSMYIMDKNKGLDGTTLLTPRKLWSK